MQKTIPVENNTPKQNNTEKMSKKLKAVLGVLMVSISVGGYATLEKLGIINLIPNTPKNPTEAHDTLVPGGVNEGEENLNTTEVSDLKTGGGFVAQHTTIPNEEGVGELKEDNNENWVYFTVNKEDIYEKYTYEKIEEMEEEILEKAGLEKNPIEESYSIVKPTEMEDLDDMTKKHIEKSNILMRIIWPDGIIEYITFENTNPDLQDLETIEKLAALMKAYQHPKPQTPPKQQIQENPAENSVQTTQGAKENPSNYSDLNAIRQLFGPNVLDSEYLRSQEIEDKIIKLKNDYPDLTLNNEELGAIEEMTNHKWADQNDFLCISAGKFVRLLADKHINGRQLNPQEESEILDEKDILDGSDPFCPRSSG